MHDVRVLTIAIQGCLACLPADECCLILGTAASSWRFLFAFESDFALLTVIVLWIYGVVIVDSITVKSFERAFIPLPILIHTRLPLFLFPPGLRLHLFIHLRIDSHLHSLLLLLPRDSLSPPLLSKLPFLILSPPLDVFYLEFRYAITIHFDTKLI